MRTAIGIGVMLAAAIGVALAQAPAPAQGGRGSTTSFPAQQRKAADPAVVARGEELYGLECRGCHGADLRGGEMGGPNLLRSPLVLSDQNGELILPVVQGSRQAQGMPAIGMTPEDVAAVAAFIHSVAARSPGQGAPPPGPGRTLNVLVGDARAGETYFAARCSSCHSPGGDLRGLGERGLSPVQLQNLWVSGGERERRETEPQRRPPPMTTRREVTVTVTPQAGPAVEGRLERIDDFVVALTEADGTPRSFRRVGDVPRVVIHDPLEAHRALLTIHTDKDIHDVTAFLAGLKE